MTTSGASALLTQTAITKYALCLLVQGKVHRLAVRQMRYTMRRGYAALGLCIVPEHAYRRGAG